MSLKSAHMAANATTMSMSIVDDNLLLVASGRRSSFREMAGLESVGCVVVTFLIISLLRYFLGWFIVGFFG